MKDEQVKQRLESVDALTSGIVYGKEEAWERLQARLDAPVARVIPWRRYALAATLLLCACTVVLFLYFGERPEEKLADTPVIAPTKQEEPRETKAADTTPQQQPVQHIASYETKKRKYIVWKKPPQMVREEDRPPLPPEQEVVIAVVSPEPPPAAPPVRKMRVVHLNDLDNSAEPANAWIYSGPALDLNKMKVVSINDVQRVEQMRKQEEEVMTIARLNRPHNILDIANRFTRPHMGDTDPLSYNPLSLRLNRKN